VATERANKVVVAGGPERGIPPVVRQSKPIAANDQLDISSMWNGAREKDPVANGPPELTAWSP